MHMHINLHPYVQLELEQNSKYYYALFKLAELVGG